MGTRAATTGRWFDSFAQEVFLSLWRMYDWLRGLEDELFARYDLTPQEYNALRWPFCTLPHEAPTSPWRSPLSRPWRRTWNRRRRMWLWSAADPPAARSPPSWP